MRLEARVPLPTGKTAGDYVRHAWVPNPAGGGYNPWPLEARRIGSLGLSDISPRGQQADIELVLQRPDKPDFGGVRRQKLPSILIPTEVSGEAARQFRWVASDGSVVELESARHLEDGRYQISVQTRTPPEPRDAVAYYQVEAREGGAQGAVLESAGSANANGYLKDDSYKFFFRPAPGAQVQSVAVSPTITRSALSWATPGAYEYHRLRVRIPPLDPAKCVDGSDLLGSLDNPPTPHLYHGRGGQRLIQVVTTRPTGMGRPEQGAWTAYLSSFLHDPRPDPGLRWRISEAVLRDAKGKLLQREGWPRFYPREYNRQGLPLRPEFYGQGWDLTVAAAARGASTLETRWAPITERLVTARFGPFDLGTAQRARRLSERRALTWGTLSLRSWQLPAVGASKNLNNEHQPLAAWFSYTAGQAGASLLPTLVEWEDESSRRPGPAWAATKVEAWNIARRRPRRPGEASATAWRSQHPPPAQDARRLWLVIHGVERRISGATFSSFTPTMF